MKLRIFKKAFPVLIAALGLGGCIGEEIPYTPDDPTVTGSPVTITVSVPGQRTPTVSRSIDGAAEAAVQDIHVLVFKSNGAGNPEVLAEHIEGQIVSQSDKKADDYKVQFMAKLKAEPAATTVVILANTPAATITAATSHANKQDVLNALVYASTNGGGTSDGWKWNTGDPYDPIPMYGEYDVTKGGENPDGLTAGMKMDGIDLVRMLARIDVANNAPGFTLSGVYVVNYNTAGYIAPAWDAKGVLSGSLPAVPMLPGAANPQSGESNAMFYEYSGSALTGEIYTYEAAPTTGDEGDPSHTNAICLIIKGKRTGDAQDSYYRIDFSAGTDASGKAPGAEGFNPSTVEYIPVYRNHRYSFEIQSITGAGYTQFGDALTSLGILNNLKTNMLVVDESGIHHTVFDGKNYLGVGAQEISVAAAGESGVALQVSTNYAGGWKASVENAAANPWLTLTTTSGQKTDKMLTFNAATLTGDAWAARSGTILLTAGLLETRVVIKQGDFRIVAEPANAYLLDGTTLHKFKVKSNTQWAVRNVSDPDKILLDSENQIAVILTRSGDPNTSTGDDFSFTLVNDPDGSLSSKTFVITFHDPSEKANDITVTITAVACGHNGTELAMRIGTNGRTDNLNAIGIPTYLTHMYGDKCWMVQNSMEGQHSGYGYGGIGGINSGHGFSQPLGANGYYYNWEQVNTNNACPDGWHLPTQDELNSLYYAVTNSGTAKNNIEGKWWCGSTNGATITTAFAGYYNLTSKLWYYGGTAGYWWYGNGRYFNGYTGGMVTNSGTNYWFSVRCVMD